MALDSVSPSPPIALSILPAKADALRTSLLPVDVTSIANLATPSSFSASSSGVRMRLAFGGGDVGGGDGDGGGGVGGGLGGGDGDGGGGDGGGRGGGKGGRGRGRGRGKGRGARKSW